jgi:glycosyltransferase involved in cell wall biosynthesis
MLTKALDIPMQLIPHRNMDIDIDTFPSDRYDMLFEWHKSAVGHPHVLISSFPPEVTAEMDGVGPKLVPYCAFEGDKVSTYTRALCNGNAFAAIWVVSQFVEKALVKGGVKEDRVFYVPPPVCDGPWSMIDIEKLRERKNRPITPDDPFVFGALGTWHKRKGFEDLVRSYFGAFRRVDPVQLTIRTSAFGKNLTIREMKAKLTERIAEIAKEFGDDDFPTSQKQPRLKLLLGTELTDAEIIEWLGSIDCYANATYGEGLGIPHVWAKANGVPMVSTGFGAVGELLGELETKGAVEDLIIDSRMEPVDPEMCRIALMFDRDTQWAVYDPNQFGFAMESQFEGGRCFDETAARLVREKFSIEACAPYAVGALRALIDDKWVKTWGL